MRILVLLAVASLACNASPEDGLASWYGYPYHGRRAANGEIYDMEKLTAAHPTLPFGTHVRVVNLVNAKTVEVRITDRGPFIAGRIIDLSHAAAREIDSVAAGVVPVQLEIVSGEGSPVAQGVFAVQVGAFRVRRNAERLAAEMQALYGAARIAMRDGDPVMWRVLVGSEETVDAARALAARVRVEMRNEPFVSRVD